MSNRVTIEQLLQQVERLENKLNEVVDSVVSERLPQELTDKYDLGSYATNITEYTDSQSQYFDADIVYDAQYDASKNAMFTYSSQLVNSLQPIDYKLMPKTFKTLLDSQGLNAVKVLTLTKEHNVQTVTFKLWLEGWDADCIDGLTKSISVQLSFVQQ